MGRPSSFRKSGGGFLNNVDGIISGYQFSDKFNGQEPTPGKFHSLYMILSARIDGADADVTTTLFGGDADAFEISDDGLTLTPVQDGYTLGANNGVAKFIQAWETLAETGASSDDDTVVNFEPIIGSRVRFVQQVNEASTKKLGKRKAADGKEYNRTDVIVDQVYEVGAAKPATKKATKPTKPGAAAKTVIWGNAQTQELAGETLLQIVAAGPVKVSKLSMAAFKALVEHPHRDEVRALITKPAFLVAVEGVEFDADAQTVSLS